MKTRILEEAYRELNSAIDYYEGEQDGLGLRMFEEFERHVKWISENPSVPPLRQGNYRRANLRTFPYYIPYIVYNDTLWILAVAHSHRKPEYWIGRIDEIG
jgi:plasmid stabilization system protein ParE